MSVAREDADDSETLGVHRAVDDSKSSYDEQNGYQFMGDAPSGDNIGDYQKAGADTSDLVAAPNGTVLRPATIRLERESNSTLALLLLSSVSVILDLSRQLCAYAVKYHNEDVYPVPSTLLVFLAELCKLIIFASKLIISGKVSEVKISYAYIVPSLLYALNNNIYYVALMFTSPPVWNILMQSRVILTALTYRFYFKKPVTAVQWFGLSLLTLAIAILQFSTPSANAADSGLSWQILVALCLALFASVTSTVGPIYTEYLLKNDTRSFDDKQCQMYMFGSAITMVMFLAQRYVTSDTAAPLLVIKGDNSVVQALIIACVSLTSGCGVIVAVIMKRLDNIVKLYTQAVSSGLTCLACTLLFPRMFQFDSMFLISLVLTSVAIYLYEVKRVECKSCGGSGQVSNS